jgi:hypothetical protein
VTVRDEVHGHGRAYFEDGRADTRAWIIWFSGRGERQGVVTENKSAWHLMDSAAAEGGQAARSAVLAAGATVTPPTPLIRYPFAAQSRAARDRRAARMRAASHAVTRDSLTESYKAASCLVTFDPRAVGLASAPVIP